MKRMMIVINDDHAYSLEDEFDELRFSIWKRLGRERPVPYLDNGAKDKIETWRQKVKESGDSGPTTHLMGWISPN